MKKDYFDAKKTGAGRDHIDIEVRVKADHVESFANEIKRATIDQVLEIIDEVAADNLIDDAIKINSVRNRVQMWLND